MEAELEDLYRWVEDHQISRPKRNINRDFSDAIPMVEILKHHFPKLVEMHNYSAKNCVSDKVVNWQTLNARVLNKLKVNISKSKIDLLAKSEPGAIESVLKTVKKKIEEVKAKGDTTDGCVDGNYNTSTGSLISKPATKKIVSMAVWKKMEADLSEKNEAIEILRKKVDHLENLLNIKEERIKDLSKQLQSIVNEPNTSATNLESSSNSRFFNIF